ncbi:hypothetical protein NKG94_06085 [Micromonospora sp. M12]
MTASEPPGRYLTWLTDNLPDITVTVLPGSHFPHLAEPATIARLLTTDGPTRLSRVDQEVCVIPPGAS